MREKNERERKWLNQNSAFPFFFIWKILAFWKVVKNLRNAYSLSNPPSPLTYVFQCKQKRFYGLFNICFCFLTSLYEFLMGRNIILREVNHAVFTFSIKALKNRFVFLIFSGIKNEQEGCVEVSRPPYVVFSSLYSNRKLKIRGWPLPLITLQNRYAFLSYCRI